MTTDRSTAHALTPEAAREELIACSCTQLDPRIVEILLEIVSGDIRVAPPHPSAAAA